MAGKPGKAQHPPGRRYDNSEKQHPAGRVYRGGGKQRRWCKDGHLWIERGERVVCKRCSAVWD